ncbi:unnamed protein product [Soboliphyme baturini]|uniref:Zinc transporter 2 n=1 Tax=Soboliphyme baturini TaxID=241478 RepID=A0A183J2G9_9BILA|nr:unnamed protein product [Soboliphyme baturini]
MTDAAHLLTDLASFLISLFSIFIASRPATRRMSFGWHRAEVIGALVSVLLIWVITGVLLYMATERLIYRNYHIEPKIMLTVASIGVCVNVIMGCVLHRYSSHSHGFNDETRTRQSNAVNDTDDRSRSSRDQESTPLRKSKPKNINVRAAFLHILGDFIQSVGVVTAAFIIYYRRDLEFIDPICTIVFAIVVLFTTLNVMRDVVNILMEGSPREISFAEVLAGLTALDGVEKVHDLHIWSLTLDKVAVSVHLAVEESKDFQALLNRGIELLRKQFGVYECTIQIERYSNDMDNCCQCKALNN